MPRVSAAASFFDCGGTSLSAALLISRLSDGKAALSFQDISLHPTPRELAAFMESRRDAALPAMDRDAYPLTKTQLGIYLESLTGGSKATYTIPYLARAAEGIGAEALKDAVKKVLDAHPGMKYVIRTDAQGMPGMVPVPDAETDIPVFEGTEEGRLDFMKTFMPVVPMMDHALFCPAVYRTPERCYLAIKTHLIFFDGTSISQFIAEMNRALAGRPLEGEECTIQQAGLYEERLMNDGSHERAKEYCLNLFRDMEFSAGVTPGYVFGKPAPASRATWGDSWQYWEDSWTEKQRDFSLSLDAGVCLNYSLWRFDLKVMPAIHYYLFDNYVYRTASGEVGVGGTDFQEQPLRWFLTVSAGLAFRF